MKFNSWYTVAHINIPVLQTLTTRLSRGSEVSYGMRHTRPVHSIQYPSHASSWQFSRDMNLPPLIASLAALGTAAYE